MRSKQINLRLNPSKLPLVALLLTFVCGYITSRYIPQLRYFAFSAFVIICLFWLYKYLTFKEHNLIINTNTLEIVLNNIPSQVIQFKQISWWLSIIYLTKLGKKQKIYIFADSVPFNSYKSFKIYSQWI